MTKAPLPFFTLPDPGLIRSGAGRDPLGLQPVWSSFGRELVPNLAGPVGQISGVTAVLLIHHLRDKLPAAQKKDAFRSYFRLMEGLLEWYLWNLPETGSRHCFGTQTFSAGAPFSVKPDDQRTLVNGLYQYYRGTCARAGLLQESWQASEAVAIALNAVWSDAASIALETALQPCLKKQGPPMVPAVVLQGSAALRSALDAVFASATFGAQIGTALLGVERHRALAGHCAELQRTMTAADIEGTGRMLAWIERLSALLTEGDPAFSLKDAVANVAKCEPFLITVQDSFDLLRNSPGITLAGIAGTLASQQEKISGRAARFLELDDARANERTRQMRELAAAAGGGTTAFLQALITHHGSVMQDRGRDAQLLLEGGQIVSVAAAERDNASILERIERGYPWDNGYYLATAGNIYQQAAEMQHG